MLESDNLDRAKVTKALESIVMPELVKHLISYGNEMSFEPQEVNMLKLTLGNSWDMKLISDVQAMAKR